ncbi:MAG TPA: endonuclease/exonuclease/phosphatase family protein [Polyangiaceae bacterium]|nr:endonuclease/exonuclease/phosphatase family protein [Polyangiaceae bacterium]
MTPLARCILLALGLLQCRSASKPASLSASPALPAPVSAQAQLERAAAPRSLTIASWNLDWLNRRAQRGPVRRGPADYQRLQRYAQRLRADVIAVQEVDGAEALQQVFAPDEYEYHVTSQRDVQRVGFAYRKGLLVERHPDLTALDVGGLRVGADLTVHVNGEALRLLAVHLKSGCFAAPLSSPRAACVKLQAQLPVLERWIDDRARAGEAFLVLGDFNRRLNARDPFYAELDDGEPPNADLSLLGEGHASRCWGGKYPEFIDHLLLSRDAAAWLQPNSFAELGYDDADAPFRSKLSDHCPIEVVLTPGVRAAPAPVPAPTAAAPPPIKGNINARHQKLYHLPGCPSYAETRIDESRGERLFATESEAIAAGWQRAAGCRR